MAIDLKKVKERLEALKNMNKKTNILKLEEGKQTLRLLPIKDRRYLQELLYSLWFK